MDYAELRFARELQERLTSIIETEASELADGYASDWSDYLKRTGRIAAFRSTLAVIEEIHETVTGRVTERGTS